MAALLTLFRHATRAETPAPDTALLDRFAVGRDEQAFAELVRRHGPVVHRICRRLVGTGAADDAFQATFLVLATRLDAARAAGSVGGWLVGVAGRVARQLRRSAARRTHHETSAAGTRRLDAVDHPIDLADQFRVLDEELTRLPARFRDPVVLCLLQGRTQEEAARELGRDARTLRRRLERAKKVLRARLERRGVVPAVAAGLVASAGSVTAAVPSDLSTRTVSTVFDFLTGGASRLAPVILAKGVATSMFTRKLTHLMAVAAAGLLAVGVVLADDTRPTPAPRATQAAPDTSPASAGQAPIGQAKGDARAGTYRIRIEAVCVETQSEFCDETGLGGNDLVGPAWTLSRRESRMINSLIRAKKKNGHLKVLAEPTVIGSDGKAAYVSAGTNVQVPANVDVNGKVTTPATETRRIGWALEVTPRVSEDAKSIFLRVESQHSSIAPQLVDLGNGVTAPAFNICTQATTAALPDGGGLAIRGGTWTDKGEQRFTSLCVITAHIVDDEGKPAAPAAKRPPPVPPPPGVVPPLKDPAPVAFPQLGTIPPVATVPAAPVEPAGMLIPASAPVPGRKSGLVPAPKPAPGP